MVCISNTSGGPRYPTHNTIAPSQTTKISNNTRTSDHSLSLTKPSHKLPPPPPFYFLQNFLLTKAALASRIASIPPNSQNPYRAKAQRQADSTAQKGLHPVTDGLVSLLLGFQVIIQYHEINLKSFPTDGVYREHEFQIRFQ